MEPLVDSDPSSLGDYELVGRLGSFCATQLHATGADVTTAQAVLRHQSSQTTLKYYMAAQMSKVRESTIELGERLAPSKPSEPDLE